MPTEKKRLTLDFSKLFPTQMFKFTEECSIELKALELEQYVSISLKLKEFASILKEKEISKENYKEPENMLEIVHLILHKFPSLLEEASGVNIEDLNKLPIDVVIRLIGDVIEVNMKAKEDLMGNLLGLVKKLPFVQKEDAKDLKKTDSSKQSKN